MPKIPSGHPARGRRFSDADLGKLETAFYGQLPIVAALLAASENEYSTRQIAADSIELIESLLDALEQLD